MPHTDEDSDIDWIECELIEGVPGKLSGRPVVRGTRIEPDAIVDGYDLGESIEELQEGFPSLSVSQIKALSNLRIGNAASSPEKFCPPEILKNVPLRPGAEPAQTL